MLSEKQVEAKLKAKVEKLGGKALKFVSPGLSGVPDRLVFMPGGRIFLVELKKPGGELSSQQVRRKKEFEALGFKYYVIDSYEKVEGFISEIQST